MTKLLFFAATLLTMSVNNCSAQEIPKIGQAWTGSTEGELYVPSPYGFEDMIHFDVGKIKFSGAVHKEKIIFISTRDTAFLINGKKYIGQPLSSLENRQDVEKVPGWGHYVKIDNEWYAGFDFKSVNPQSKVLFLFKYEFRY